ncbi:hypothetical protein NKR23_g12431 [Pleurostoma richardsiae]|uniref:Uncharacterized protein n=1 Tax=Pleurostoma richardsiae TaxID=41990 RepID=A0AA38R1E0_9PEZI|nr:hypothetical protein NKR23_g12431 [Pleurostoma richardsiae]
MSRLDKIKKAYGVDLYFCAKYRKFYEYMSTPHFRPSAREIDGNYPPSERRTPDSFKGDASPFSSGDSNNDVGDSKRNAP